MLTAKVTPALISSSVISVPPLARDADGNISVAQNERIIRYLERGGISTLLYGGNANLYHVRLSEYAALLQQLSDLAGPSTWVIPSAGPAYGTLIDQARVLRDFPSFPTVMVLPQREIADSAGIATGIARFAEACGRPIVLYLKHDRWLDVAHAAKLDRDGVVSMVKYAVVRDDAADDAYLRELLEKIPAERIVSGMGEQPAIVHMRQFGLAGFTSGCVCVAPRLSQSMLVALQHGEDQRAEQIRQQFEALEAVRNDVNPIRVLHRAVEVAGVAETGQLSPLLSDVDPATVERIRNACGPLLKAEQSL
ncbi:MAG: dihydrodipicolinate synthase family protein [Pirellulales bacterium]